MLFQKIKQHCVKKGWIFLVSIVPGLGDGHITAVWVASRPGPGLLLHNPKAKVIVLAVCYQHGMCNSVAGFIMDAVHNGSPDCHKFLF